MDVLIVRGPEKTEAGDEVCRVVPCTDSFLWRHDFSSAEDVAVQSDQGEEYIAHLWLTGTMSVDQLSNYLGRATPEGVQVVNDGLKDLTPCVPNVSEWRTKVTTTLNARHRTADPEVVLEYERLAQCAACLNLTAHSRHMRWQQTVQAQLTASEPKQIASGESGPDSVRGARKKQPNTRKQ